MISTGIWTLLVRRLVTFTYTMAWPYLLDGWYNRCSHESLVFFLYNFLYSRNAYGSARLSLNARALHSRFPGSCGCYFYYFCCLRTSDSIKNYPCQLWNYPFFRFWPDSVKNVPIFIFFHLHFICCFVSLQIKWKSKISASLICFWVVFLQQLLSCFEDVIAGG